MLNWTAICTITHVLLFLSTYAHFPFSGGDTGAAVVLGVGAEVVVGVGGTGEVDVVGEGVVVEALVGGITVVEAVVGTGVGAMVGAAVVFLSIPEIKQLNFIQPKS